MKPSNNIFNLIRFKKCIANTIFKGFTLCFVLLTLSLTSCNFIDEDLEPCAPAPKHYTVVNFIYDYNMSGATTGQYEDWFDSHAGSVYLYIFDEDGLYLDRREKHKEFFQRGEDFSMVFTDEELIPGKTYDFVAVAQGNTIGVVEDEDYQWFKLLNPMEQGKSTIKDYILKLDRDTNNDGFSEVGVVNYKDQYGQNRQMIDTLWTTKPDEVQTVTIRKEPYVPSIEQKPDVVTNVEVPMMRITNAITINIHGKGFEASTNPDDFHVVIYFPHGNGTVDFTGNTLPAQELYYQSLIKSMQIYKPKDTSADASGEVTPNESEEQSTRADNDTYALHSLFGVSRLQVNDESQLQLRDATKEGYPVIWHIDNFSSILAQLLNDYYKDNQEYLDREYNFQVDIAVDNKGNLGYMDVSVQTLAWARRHWFINL